MKGSKDKPKSIINYRKTIKEPLIKWNIVREKNKLVKNKHGEIYKKILKDNISPKKELTVIPVNLNIV